MKALLAPVCLGVALALGAVGSSAAVGGMPSFAASKRYAVSSPDGHSREARSVVVGDLNGNGRPDIVTVNEDETVSVFIAKPSGGFGARADYLGAGHAAEAAIADLNGDGYADVAVADADGFVTVLLNRGDGVLSAKRDYDAGTGRPVSIAAADLDGDRAPDLVTANPEEGTISVLLSNRDGTFGAAHVYPIGARGDEGSVAVGDLDGDGKLDVVTGDGEFGLDAGFVSVLLNRGDGTFQVAQVYDAQGADSVALGDLNGDGKLDVAVTGANYGSGVAVLLNRGDGSLQARRVYPVLKTPDGPGGPQSIAIADLNGDGKADLVTANSDHHVSLLLNDGTAAFHRSIDLGTGKCDTVFESDHGLAAGDLNGDGRADFAVAADSLCVSLAKPGLCNVQELQGLKLANARTLLARAHCRVGAIRRAHAAETRRGLVSAQRPGFGKVLPAGAKVDLVVSLGRR
jgi:hypothetical protein